MVEREVQLPVVPAEAWRWLTEPSLVGEWFEDPIEMDLRPGGRVTFRFEDGAERGALVESVEPGRRLVFRWLPFERLADGSLVRRPVTTLEWLLEPSVDGSVLRVTERPLGAGSTGARLAVAR
jgi:uncharacterized protein YndB with AHSA1/START domain